MRVTIEAGVYDRVTEVKIKSMFEKGKGRMTQRTATQTTSPARTFLFLTLL